MVTVHPSARTTLKFSLGKAKAREGKWGLAFGLLCVSTSIQITFPRGQVGQRKGPGLAPLCQTSRGASPAQLGAEWPSLEASLINPVLLVGLTTSQKQMYRKIAKWR